LSVDEAMEGDWSKDSCQNAAAKALSRNKEMIPDVIYKFIQ
jgi:hypothetical protein